MTTTFDERGQAFESRSAQEEELRFRAPIRRNRLLATWAVERMRRIGDTASASVTSFAEEAVVIDDEALLARPQANLRVWFVDESLPDLRREMERCIAPVDAGRRAGLALDQGAFT